MLSLAAVGVARSHSLHWSHAVICVVKAASAKPIDDGMSFRRGMFVYTVTRYCVKIIQSLLLVTIVKLRYVWVGFGNDLFE